MGLKVGSSMLARTGQAHFKSFEHAQTEQNRARQCDGGKGDRAHQQALGQKVQRNSEAKSHGDCLGRIAPAKSSASTTSFCTHCSTGSAHSEETFMRWMGVEVMGSTCSHTCHIVVGTAPRLIIGKTCSISAESSGATPMDRDDLEIKGIRQPPWTRYAVSTRAAHL